MKKQDRYNGRSNRGYEKNTKEYFVDGNVVRKLEAQEVYELEQPQEDYELELERRKRREKALRRRERVHNMDLFSLITLTIAIIVTASVLVRYLKVQSQVTAITKEIASIESEIILLKEENRIATESITSNINLDYIYKKATKKLGMVHPNKEQVVTYESTKDDSVKQYGDIPEGTDQSIIDKIFDN